MTREEHLQAIKDADAAYYNQDNPLLTDSEYDRLRAEYIALYGPADLDYVPGDANKGFAHFRHPYPVVSLDKVKQGEDARLLALLRKLWPVVHEPKIDGLTVVAYPQPDGSYRFVTRGSGELGDVLPNFISKYEGPGKTSFMQPVRGEVYLTFAAFAEIKARQEEAGEPVFRNIRNAAAGILRSKERSPYIDCLSYLCYDVPGADISEEEKMRHIAEETPFTAVELCPASSPEEEAAALAPYYESLRAQDIPVDGVVIKCNQAGSLARFGMTGHHPNNAFAYKAEQEKHTTRLLRVEWQVGRRFVTPVAVLEPVEIDSTIVSKASIHNVNIITQLGLHLGDEVEIEKANEIIPQITRVLSHGGGAEIEVPRCCPSCGTPLGQENGQLFCTGESCAERVAQNMAYLGSKKMLNIDGLSIETCRKIVALAAERGLELTQNLIFRLREEDFLALPGFAAKSAQRLAQGTAQACAGVDLAHFIACLCFPGIGLNVGTVLMEEYGSLEKLENELAGESGTESGDTAATESGAGELSLFAAESAAAEGSTLRERLQNLAGIGGVSAGVIASPEFLAALRELRRYITPTVYAKVAPKAVATEDGAAEPRQLTFVITGKMAHPRSYYEGLIKAAGHKTAGSTSGKTDYLVIADTNSTSTKAKKARELGVKLISPEELEEMLK